MRHKDRAHALLSPSSSHRWLVCTPSAVLEDGYPDQSNPQAAEGTLAHEVAEIRVKELLGAKDAEKRLKKLEKEVKKQGFSYADMAEFADSYAEYIRDKMQPGDVIMPEQQVSLESIIPDCYGTCDCVICNEDTLTVVDYKYGRHVGISAKGNTQLRIYALGAVAEYGSFYDFDTVNLCIYQPRKDSITEETISLSELLDWADKVLKPQGTLAAAGDGELKPSDHCQFCKAAGACKALYEQTLDTVKKDLTEDTTELKSNDAKQVAESLNRVPLVEIWLKAVKDMGYNLATSGVTVPGYKLVEGRSNRKYTDEKKLRKKLRELGYKPREINKPTELLGITALKKVLGGSVFSAVVEPELTKPPGKPVLVPVGDKRDEIALTDDFEQLK